MAAGLGFKTFTTGEVLTAADTNGYLMQGVLVFASAAARDAAITSPQEGQFAYLKDTNVTYYYDGAAWVVSGATGDITAVTAGKGLTGGGASGDVTVSLATTAKGDLVVGTGASTAGVLSVSSDGSTIVADSSTSSGLRYQPAYNGNAIINGGFDIWQRGTTFTAADVYTADRWRKNSQTTSTVSRQTTSDTTNLPNIQYCARVARNSASTDLSSVGVVYTAETADSIRFAGQAVVVSFYARSGANYSSASSALSYNFYTGTGTDQSRSFASGFTGEANIASATKTLTTTWQRFSFTATVGATATELALMFFYTPVGTAGAADYFEITGVQLELGSVPTTFKRSAAGGGSIQGETSACQRYYANAQTDARFPSPNASASWVTLIFLPVPMRTTPTVAFTGAATSANIASATLQALSNNNLIRNNLVTTSGSNTDTYYVRDLTASAEL